LANAVGAASPENRTGATDVLAYKEPVPVTGLPDVVMLTPEVIVALKLVLTPGAFVAE
jgi:hypothetical protein